MNLNTKPLQRAVKMDKDKQFELQKILLGFALTTIVGSIITILAQKLDFDYQQKQNLIQTEKAAAQKCFEDVSVLLDTRVYKMRKIIWAYQDSRPESDIIARWNDYSTFLELWNNNINKNSALISRYFGNKRRSQFEAIHSKFREAGNIIQPLRYTSIGDSSKIKNAKKIIDDFNSDIYLFDASLLNQIQNENIGVFLKNEDKIDIQ
ncbi:MAG TPA: hypothetical protein VF598_12915 [Hymenobacter sp.]